MTKSEKALEDGGDTNSVRQVSVGQTTKSQFCDNNVKTSKYNLLTFWILNPLEQFRRIANLYFLLGKLSSWFSLVITGWYFSDNYPDVSPRSPGLSLNLSPSAALCHGKSAWQSGL